MMDATQHHTFLSPTTCFSVACFAFSVLALSAVWRNHSATTSSPPEDALPKAKAGQRRAVDSVYVSDGPFRRLGQENAGPTTSQSLAELIELCAALAGTLRAGRDADATMRPRFTVMTLLSELSGLTTSLCRMQRMHVAAQTGSNDNTTTLLDTTLAGLREALLFAQVASTSTEAWADDALATAVQQLRDQRPAISFILERSDPQPTLPPTPPCESNVASATKDLDSSTYDLSLPHTSGPVITPSVDTKAWIEPPPEYSPPSSSSALHLLPSDQKVATKSSVPIPPEPPATQLSTDDSADTSLHSAVTTNDLPTLLHLLNLPNADPNLPSPTSDHRTPLHQAAHLNYFSLIPPLLNAGALLTAEDAAGDTPLHLAAWAGNVEALTALLGHDTSAPYPHPSVDHLSGRDAYSPLWCAVSASHPDAARVLISRFGADVHLRSSSSSSNASGPNHATNSHSSSSAEQDGTGPTLLHQSAILSQTPTLTLLLSHGARVNALDAESNTPLHYAATAGSIPCIRALLRSGADVALRQRQGFTALHWAAYKGHPAAVTLLVNEGGAEVDARTTATDGGAVGATALHLAASRGHGEVCAELVRLGARVGMKGVWNGVEGSARKMARVGGFGAVAEVLERARAGAGGSEKSGVASAAPAAPVTKTAKGMAEGSVGPVPTGGEKRKTTKTKKKAS